MHEIDHPLDDQERAQVLDAAFARIDDTARAGRGRSRVGRVAIVGTVVMLAAALVLWIALPRGSTDEIGALPGYAATRLDGGRSVVRSTAAPRELGPDDKIDWVFTPSTPIRDHLDVAIVAAPAVGAARIERVTDRVERSSAGAIRMSGTLRRFVELAPGHWRIVVVIGPAGALPTDADEVLSGATTTRWRAVPIELDIVAPAP